MTPVEDTTWKVDELHVPAPDGYHFLTWNGGCRFWVGTEKTPTPKGKLSHGHGDPVATSDMGWSLVVRNVREAIFSVRVWFELDEEQERAWEASAYLALREAALADYLEKRKMLQDRRARLLAELADRDALTLRKIEREELMKGVIRWLFGPGFRFAPTKGGQAYYDSSGAVADLPTWSTVLNHGALVSFLHQAVEWENINSFLYPYFWTPRKRWLRRLGLRHADAIHEAFLRAGAARVVLPIRRGWEKAFLSVLATGTVDGLDGTSHPYMTIAEELEAYAKTNYPGIIPANPEDIDPDEATKNAEGILIGSWYEYTPTSALDIKIGESTPSEGTPAEQTFAPPSP